MHDVQTVNTHYITQSVWGCHCLLQLVLQHLLACILVSWILQDLLSLIHELCDKTSPGGYIFSWEVQENFPIKPNMCIISWSMKNRLLKNYWKKIDFMGISGEVKH